MKIKLLNDYMLCELVKQDSETQMSSRVMRVIDYPVELATLGIKRNCLVLVEYDSHYATIRSEKREIQYIVNHRSVLAIVKEL